VRSSPLLLALLLGAAIALSPDGVTAEAVSKNVLQVRVVGLRNSKGREVCTLFSSAGADGYPGDASKALRSTNAPVQARAATCKFAGIAAGEYAIVTFHDENSNGKFDRNLFGLPEEQYGFSNNLRPLFAPPKFSQAAFEFRGGEQSLTIQLAN
jgi:uncharacterized protein (DUF2141 family)